MEQSVQYGAWQAVNNCVRLKKGEKVVMITDNETAKIADAIYHEAVQVSPLKHPVFVMEKFGKRPEDGSSPLVFPEEIARELADADVSFFCAKGKAGELKSFRRPMLDVIEANKKLRHGHMPGINEELMVTGMCADYAKVHEISQKVYEIVHNARQIRVTTPAGTGLTAYFTSQRQWQICDGFILPGHWSNLPDGEVFSCVTQAPKGRVVVDGTLGDFFCEKYGDMSKNPLIIEIAQGRISRFFCMNQQIERDFKRYIEQDADANRLSEFAIGTNIGLDHLVGNLLQDEKFPGVHVAFGDGYDKKTGCRWKSEAHVDCVMRDCTVYVDGRKIMEGSRFLI
ncbi:MAG TPA: aminopeptidase [Nanoarchaeota archaeon]|nr:aminopeptidase [Nanoarchaeota archaeon]